MADYSDDISASVARILDAAQAAALRFEREVQSIDLLRALLDDEGHATEVLRNAGLAELPEEPVIGSAAASLSIGKLLRTARQLAAGTEQTSSLHLLVALVQSDEAAEALLAPYGLSPTHLNEQFSASPGRSSEPIEVDLQIEPAEAPIDDLSATWRVLDAAGNRAREGLRVLEDHARFALSDSYLNHELKDLRHRLSRLLISLIGEQGIRHRNTPRDVGTRIHTTFETRRESELDIVRANAARSQEALRTLEEYAKRLDSYVATQIGELRYRSYTLEQSLLTASLSRQRFENVSVCLLVTDALSPLGLKPTVSAALAGGCRMIQLREKSLPDSQWLVRARLMREWTREAGALLIINDRPDLAVLVDADGVHVGQDDLPVSEVRRIVGGNRIIGVSTHNVLQIRQAVLDGADYLGVGPVFPSQTKAFDDFAGLEFVRAAAKETSLPWFAIGGIRQENIHEVVAAGGRRVAVTGAISSADDPATATRRLIAALNRPSQQDADQQAPTPHEGESGPE